MSQDDLLTGSSTKQPYLTLLVFFVAPEGSKCAFQSNRSSGMLRCVSFPDRNNSQNSSLEAASGKRPEKPVMAILASSNRPVGMAGWMFSILALRALLMDRHLFPMELRAEDKSVAALEAQGRTVHPWSVSSCDTRSTQAGRILSHRIC